MNEKEDLINPMYCNFYLFTHLQVYSSYCYPIYPFFLDVVNPLNLPCDVV